MECLNFFHNFCWVQISPTLLEDVSSVASHVANAFKAIDEATAKANAGEKNPDPSPALSAGEIEKRRLEEERKQQEEIKLRQAIVKTVTILAKKVVLENMSKPVLEIETDFMKLQVRRVIKKFQASRPKVSKFPSVTFWEIREINRTMVFKIKLGSENIKLCF